MSLIKMDGFENYATAAGTSIGSSLGLAWDATSGTQTTRTGRFGGLACEVSAAGGTSFIGYNVSTLGSVIVGFALKISVSHRFFSARDGSNEGLNLRSESDGNIGIYFGNTQLEVTTGIDCTDWVYVEFKFVIHDSLGSYTLNVDGEEVGFGAGIDTQISTNAYVTNLRFGTAVTNNSLATFDDLYVCDTGGSAPYNDFLGPVLIELITPNGDGDSSQWTPTGAGSTSAERVDEIPNDGDTTYVSGGTVGHKELWTYTDLSLISGAVLAVKVHSEDRYSGSGSFDNAVSVVKSGGNEADSSVHQYGANYFFPASQKIFTVDPATASAWTSTTVNSAQFGVKAAA